MKNLKKGFTLIELMIVVAIIAILAVVAAPKFGQQLKKAKDSKAISLAGTYRSALTMNSADNDSVYATSFAGLTDSVDNKTKESSYAQATHGSAAPAAYTTASFPTGAGSTISTMVGTSSIKAANNKFFVNMTFDGTTTEASIIFTTASGNDTKATSWSAY